MSIRFHSLDMVDGTYNTAEDLMALLKQARGNDPRLSTIDVERKKLPDSYLRALLEAVVSNPFVTRMKMYKVGINDAQATAISQLIRHNRYLNDLDLSKNDLSDKACNKVREATICPTDVLDVDCRSSTVVDVATTGSRRKPHYQCWVCAPFGRRTDLAPRNLEGW